MEPADDRQMKTGKADVTRLQQQLFSERVVSRRLLDAVPSPLLIINEQWRVVYANRAVLDLVGGASAEAPAGLAEGEAFHCIHGAQSEGEGAEHPTCRVCGVARLLARSLQGEEANEDCHLTCDLAGTGSSLHLRVWATPLEFHRERFSILNLVDIGDRYRKELLENACCHDLLNTLTSIRGVLSVMKGGEIEDRDEICLLLEKMTQDSIEEINTLRLLDKAEKRELIPHPETFRSRPFLDFVRQTYRCHPAAEGRELRVDDASVDRDVVSDRQLLRRIVGNMMVNALEATEAGRTVALGCREEGGGVRFWVHNEKAVPPELRGNIFQHDISSKGHIRGLGTYSIQVLGSLLGGEARCESSEATGTTFSIWLPGDA